MTEGEKNLSNKIEAKGYSQAEEHSIVYTWEINGITSFIKSAKSTKEDVIIDSPEFSTGATVNDLWFLRLKIKKDESSRSKSWISVFLQPKNENKKIRTKFLLFLLNNEGKRIFPNLEINNETSDEWVHKFFVKCVGYGYHEFVKIDELLEKRDQLLENDVLSVGIDLIVYDEFMINNSTIRPLDSLKRKLNDDIKDFFYSKKKCDVLISVGQETFTAHKFVLSVRSCVFEAMFTHDMTENKESKITIPDIDSKIFKKILDFIYTDAVDDLDSDVEELLEAADKYQLQPLKEICEDHLSKSISLENAIKILILADSHNALRLKEFATNFVVSNFIKLKSTDGIKQLEEHQPSVFLIVLKKCLALSAN